MTPVVEVKNLTKTFGKEKAVNDFSIEIEKGDVFAFLGSNGSGKTTTFRCLLDIYKPNSGAANVFGKRYSSDMSLRIGYLPEERGLYTKTKVGDIFDYFGRLRGMSAQKRTKLTDEYLERVGLKEHKDKKLSALSSGMQQKVQIGVTILHKPELLILDEPFKGLDPLNRQLFLDMFEEERKRGATIIYSTHVVDEVERFANRLVMIKNGKRVLYGTTGEVRDQFGTNNMFLYFRGDIPEKTELYTARKEHNFAELKPKEGKDINEIIKFLIDKGVFIEELKIDRPSLNSIFIEKAKQKDE